MAREPKAVAIIIDALVVHTRLLHINGIEACLKFTLERMAVADKGGDRMGHWSDQTDSQI